MRVSILDEVTAGEILEGIQAAYGSPEALAAYIREHPHDIEAQVALHDLREYRSEPADKRISTRQEVIIPDDELDELTVKRLEMLLSLKRLGGRARSIRSLAGALGRDVKNVSEDVHALRELGLLQVKRRAKGRPHEVSLPGKRMDLHLVEAEA